MRREDLYDIVNKLDPSDQTKTILVMRAGFGISVDLFYRFETQYLVVRGREGGTNDDGRAFFVPYEEVVYVKVERVVHPNDLRRMFGEPIDGTMLEDELESVGLTSSNLPLPVSLPTAPLSPNEIARQNLLDRIRAARTATTASRANGK